MINATDLRIGNYILYQPISNESGEIRKVTGIVGGITSFSRVYFHTNNNEGSVIHFIKPIPLTPEILKLLGFKIEIFEGEDQILIHPFHGLSGGYLTTDLEPNRIFWDKYNGTETKYVHELQNLLYVLTGFEFNVNLSETSVAEGRTT